MSNIRPGVKASTPPPAASQAPAKTLRPSPVSGTFQCMHFDFLLRSTVTHGMDEVFSKPFRGVLFLLPALVFGCAEGGAPADAGRILDAGRRDAGRSDAGGCMDDGHAGTCAMARDLGELMAGESTEIEGNLHRVTDADWFRVAFPPISMPGTFGGGSPQITLTGDNVRMQVLNDCSTPVTCGEGTGQSITEYTFTDNQSEMMAGPVPDGGVDPSTTYTSRDTEWPDSLHIRVFRQTNANTCSPYSISIER